MNRIITPPGGGPGPQPQPSAQINIDASQLEDVHCEKCGSMVFVQCYVIKKIPAMLSPSGRDSYAPVQLFRCGACGHINQAFVAGAASAEPEPPQEEGEEDIVSTDLNKIKPLKPEE